MTNEKTGYTPGTLIKKNFFFIDSENLSDVKSHLYGFCIAGNEIFNGNESGATQALERNTPPRASGGAFVFVKRSGNEIEISQDYAGAYGIYFFRHGDYFALSNSFLLMTDNLKKIFPLTLNRDFINSMLMTGMTMMTVSETPIEEIKLLGREQKILIDVSEKQIHFEKIGYLEDTVNPYSEEGIKIIDEWHKNWTGFIRNLTGKTKNISVDLSGGFDSRMVFMLFLTSGIDMKKVKINSSTAKVHTFEEDLSIATEITKYFGLKVNENIFEVETVPIDYKESVNISFMLKLGIHSQMQYQSGYNIKPLYQFGGGAGENLRNYWIAKNFEQFFAGNFYVSIERKFMRHEEFTSSRRRLMERANREIEEKFGDPNEKGWSVPDKFYIETSTRYHNGRETVEAFIANRLRIMPLLDPLLHRLKRTVDDNATPNILFPLILDRYCKKLTEFPLDLRRNYNEQALTWARETNEKFPLKPENKPLPIKIETEIQPTIFVPPEKENSPEEKKSGKTPQEYVSEIFRSDNVKKIFLSEFSSEIYNHAVQYEENAKFYSLSRAHLIIAAVKFLTDCRVSQYLHSKSVSESLAVLPEKPVEYSASKEFLQAVCENKNYDGQKISELLKKFRTARIEIKNTGASSNDVRLIPSDSNCEITCADLFSGNGAAYLVKSSVGKIKLRITCIGDGIISMIVKPDDLRDETGKILPLMIDCTDFKVNGEKLLRDITPPGEIYPINFFPSSTDRPCGMGKQVKDGEILILEINWEPHRYRKAEFISIAKKIRLQVE